MVHEENRPLDSDALVKNIDAFVIDDGQRVPLLDAPDTAVCVRSEH